MIYDLTYIITSAPQDRWSQDKHIKLVNIISNLGAGMLTRAMAKQLSAASAHECLFVEFLFKEEPKKVSEALKRPGWVDAMQDELNQFARNKSRKNECKRYQANPKESYLIAVKRIFKYLKGTLSLGLWYPKCLGFNLKGNSDFDYGACNMDSISTSAEAEYVATAGCCTNILLMKSQLTDYDIIYEKRLLSATITLIFKVKDLNLRNNKWYQSSVRSFNQEKNNIQAQHKKKMVKTSSSSENKPCCSKACKKNTKRLNSKITKLTDKLFDAKNMIYHYKLGLAQVEARLAEHRDRELKYSSKDLDRLLESQRLDKNKERLGYSVVPLPPTQIYSPPKKDMSWTGLPKFTDDTIIDYSRPSPTIESNTNDTNINSFVTETRESSNIITSKPAIKFVKAVDRPAERPTTDKVETAKKPSVKYAKLYRKTTKSSKIRGNQRNWNNLKSNQLGANFVMKKKACYNCCGIDHLSYDYGKWVKMGRSCPKNNNNHKSMQPRPAIYRVDRFPIVDLKFSIAFRRFKTAAPRLNMNSTRPQTTQDLMIILIQIVQRLERELKARTLIHKVDRGRSRSVMAWVPKKMPLKRTSTSEAPAMTQAAIRKLVADNVATTLETQAATTANTNNPNRNYGLRRTPIARKCTYEKFMSYQPFYFNGMEGAVSLIRWLK
uniref:Reverse transcriptase domain-containing protein n=1 Tax=Tanacetum cinerariifolium TaxID=118510 RepID=A0A699GSG0_TANCI|nr:hypothetical protein [Tanacetum cinerariifolium]